jgi:hypothetical protein
MFPGHDGINPIVLSAAKRRRWQHASRSKRQEIDHVIEVIA